LFISRETKNKFLTDEKSEFLIYENITFLSLDFLRVHQKLPKYQYDGSSGPGPSEARPNVKLLTKSLAKAAKVGYP
jgi:hypothetical protein